MANKKISALDPAQAVSPDDLLAIVQSINNSLGTRKVKVEDLLSSCSGGVPIETTYAQLKEWANNSQLKKGAYYLITNFQTIYIQPVLNIDKQGDVEPLIVKAIAPNKLAEDAVSLIYPEDVIRYELTGMNCDWNTTNSKGQIIYRKDTVWNNECHYDFRNIRFPRWFYNSSSFPDFDANTAYHTRDVVKINDNVYVAFGDNISGISPTDDDGYKVWAMLYSEVSKLDYSLVADTDIVGYISNGEVKLVRPERRYDGEGLWSDRPDKLAGLDINSAGQMYECLTFSIPNQMQQGDPMYHHNGVFSYNNQIGKAFKEYPAYAGELGFGSVTKHTLNNIVLWGSNGNTFGSDCINNTLIFSFKNTFGKYCRGITMTYSDLCTLGGECYSTLITLSNSIDQNKRCGECAIHQSNGIKFGNDGYRNYSSLSKHINIGNGCTGTYSFYSEDCKIDGNSRDIAFSSSSVIRFNGHSEKLYTYQCINVKVAGNSAGNNFKYSENISFEYVGSSNNTIESCSNVSFGKECCRNTLHSATHITFGHYCMGNRIGQTSFTMDSEYYGNGATGVTLANFCTDNVISEGRSIKLNSYCKNNRLFNNKAVSLDSECKSNTIINSIDIILLSSSMSNNLEYCGTCTFEQETVSNYLAYCNRVKIGMRSTNNGSYNNNDGIENRMYYCNNIVIGVESNHNKLQNCNNIEIENNSNSNTLKESHQITLGMRCNVNSIEQSSNVTFEKECNSNLLKESNMITFEMRCCVNSIHNSYQSIFGKYCSGNFLNSCSDNIFESRCHHFSFENCYDNYVESHNTGNKDMGVVNYSGITYPYKFTMSKVRILRDTHPQLDLLEMDIDNNSFVSGTNQPKNRVYTDFKILRSRVLGLLDPLDTEQEIVNYKYYMTYRDEDLDIVKELLATTEITEPGNSGNGWIDSQTLI